MAENKIKYGIVGLLSLLVAFGGYITITQGELDNAYVCLATEEWGIFYGGISGTGLSAYPYSENRSDFVRCSAPDGSKSTWVKLTDYAEELGIDPLDLLKQNVTIIQPQNIGKKFLCDINGCVEIN